MSMEDVAAGTSSNDQAEPISRAPLPGQETPVEKSVRIAIRSGERVTVDDLQNRSPRQITRAWVDDIRIAAEFIEGGHGARPVAEHRKPWAARLRAYADILESCLPPR